MLLVHRLQANDLTTDPTVWWQVWVGHLGAIPKFDGTDLLTPELGYPTGAAVSGTLAGGEFATTVPGPVSIKFAFAGAPSRVDLRGVQIAATVSGSGCTWGCLGGAWLATDVQSVFVPALFDPNHDGAIIAMELADSSLIAAMLVPAWTSSTGRGSRATTA